MVFVLLVTTIVGTVLDVLEKVVAHPGGVIYLLADALPGFSNFYINYLMLGCLMHVFDLLRPSSLAKYLVARVRGEEPIDARRASEPEDSRCKTGGETDTATPYNSLMSDPDCLRYPVATTTKLGWAVVGWGQREPDFLCFGSVSASCIGVVLGFH